MREILKLESRNVRMFYKIENSLDKNTVNFKNTVKNLEITFIWLSNDLSFSYIHKLNENNSIVAQIGGSFLKNNLYTT